MADLEVLKNAVIKGDQNAAMEITTKALEEGMAPEDVLRSGLIAGMDVVGRAFKKNEVYVPEVLIAARAMKMAMEILEPKLVEAGVEPIGTIIVGTVKGDLHDIGKNLVCMMLKGAGFNVIDLGTDVAPEKFVEAVKENSANTVGLSALLTTTMPMMDKTVAAFREADVEAKVMVGGAPVTQEYADKIGAQGYAADAATAVDVAKDLM
ncbi:MAG: corrinoid protein [Sedimentisphaerales bacterium]|nr:corrinoid protein [Sedimentisphaerales bacterium]